MSAKPTKRKQTLIHSEAEWSKKNRFTRFFFEDTADESLWLGIRDDDLGRDGNEHKYGERLSAHASSKLLQNPHYLQKEIDAPVHRKRLQQVFEIKALASLNHCELIKRIPPFSAAAYGFDDPFVVMEKVNVTFEQWMFERGKPFAADPRVARLGGGRRLLETDRLAYQKVMDGVFAQLVIALRSYQKYAGFLHNDLHTRNLCLMDRSGTGDMVIRTSDDRVFVFGDDVPLLKLIDVADGRVDWRGCKRARGRETSVINGATHSFDLFRFCACLIPDRPGRNGARGMRGIERDVSEGLRDCIRRVVYPSKWKLPENWFLANPNAMTFPYLHDFPTPSSFLGEASLAPPLARFVSDVVPDVVPANFFSECENDGWTYAGSDEEAAFDRREWVIPSGPYEVIRPFPRPIGCQQTLVVSSAHSVVSRMWTYRMSTPFKKASIERGAEEALRCYGETAPALKKMVMRTIVVLFQKAMRAYFEKYCLLENDNVSAEDLLNACLFRASDGCEWLFFQSPLPAKYANRLTSVASTMDARDFENANVPAERHENYEEVLLSWYFDCLHWATNPLFYRLPLPEALSLCDQES